MFYKIQLTNISLVLAFVFLGCISEASAIGEVAGAEDQGKPSWTQVRMRNLFLVHRDAVFEESYAFHGDQVVKGIGCSFSFLNGDTTLVATGPVYPWKIQGDWLQIGGEDMKFIWLNLTELVGTQLKIKFSNGQVRVFKKSELNSKGLPTKYPKPLPISSTELRKVTSWKDLNLDGLYLTLNDPKIIKLYCFSSDGLVDRVYGTGNGMFNSRKTTDTDGGVPEAYAINQDWMEIRGCFDDRLVEKLRVVSAGAENLKIQDNSGKIFAYHVSRVQQ